MKDNRKSEKNQSVLLTILVGFCFLVLLLLVYQSDPDKYSFWISKVSHRKIHINRDSLKNKLTKLSTSELKVMESAGQEVIEWHRLLSRTGASVVSEVLKGQVFLEEGDHYPLHDTFDQETFSQYYYHAHRRGEHGHFHLFLRQGGMLEKVIPLIYNERNKTLNDIDTYSHLIAISMDHEGYPIGLFTTNRWVTGEDWYTADHVTQMVSRFHVGHAHPSWVTNRWLSAMLKLFLPQIVDLVYERDQTLMQWHAGVSLVEALNDHKLEVTSETQISVDVQLDVIQEILKERGDKLPANVFKT